jgi:hypothetical protein
MRNYRIIAKQNNMGAWGSGRSQVISPVRDRIIFKINREEFSLIDTIPIITDSLVFVALPEAPKFTLLDNIFYLEDSTTMRVDAEPLKFSAKDEIDGSTVDEMDVDI